MATTNETPVNRVGQAVVSFILSIVSIIVFILWFNLTINLGDRVANGYSTDNDVQAIWIIIFSIFLILYLVSFILGWRARKSSAGRGLAIAGLTFNFLFLLVILFFIVLAIIIL